MGREVLRLKTNSFTKRSWFVDKQGKRCSKKFKITFQQQAGPVTIFNTNKGTILYSKYSERHERHSPYFGSWTGVTRLSNNVYLVGWQSVKGDRSYRLLNEKLERVTDNYAGFMDVKMLTPNLLGVKTIHGWGIIDNVTGKFVEQPKYSEIERRNGKIMGKITQVIESEIEINC